MMTRDLVHRDITSEGIKYSAGENATTFLDSVTSTYLHGLKDRAAWLVDALGSHTDQEFKSVMRQFFDDWVEEFQQVQRSMGGEA
ncbi:MAG: hypothetical protein BroJett026_35380 [Betaproteobacteria bacterium]|nr:MAG: hypothetical protein BroJett026_35380 [Betaproteobacteria bacterium]